MSEEKNVVKKPNVVLIQVILGIFIFAAGIVVGTSIKSDKVDVNTNIANPTIPNVSGTPVNAEDPYKDLKKVTLDEAKKLYDSENVVFIDARSESSYKANHIKGAISIPVNLVGEKIIEHKKLIAGKTLVTYCSGDKCMLSYKTAQKLDQLGYKNVLVFYGGWPAWTGAGYPVGK